MGPNLFIFFAGLLRLHGLLRLVGFLHFNQGGAGYAENAVNVDPHFDLHLGAFTRGLWDHFLDKELTCGIKNKRRLFHLIRMSELVLLVNVGKKSLRQIHFCSIWDPSNPAKS